MPQRFRAEDHARRKAREELEDAMNSRDLALREQQLEVRLQVALHAHSNGQRARQALLTAAGAASPEGGRSLAAAA